MAKRILGRIGHRVSRVAFGTTASIAEFGSFATPGELMAAAAPILDFRGDRPPPSSPSGIFGLDRQQAFQVCGRQLGTRRHCARESGPKQ